MSLRLETARLLESHSDYLENLSKEVGRNLNYEFNEYHKKRREEGTFISDIMMVK